MKKEGFDGTSWDWERTGEAFTMVETLVVLVIIGLLAALGLGLIGVVTRKAAEARVRAELGQIVSAIENYKAHFGYYPPDNPLNSVTNQLYYELTGLWFNNGTFTTARGDAKIPQMALQQAFHVDNVVNAAKNKDEIRSFIELKAMQHQIVWTNPNMEVLTLTTPWPTNLLQFPPPMPPGATRVNPWRYVSTKPLHNAKSYDLWAEVIIGRERKIIGNWKE